MDEIAQRWGRTVPDGEPELYVQSAIEEQQVILAYVNQVRARIFAARIDFEARDPAAGALWFFDAEGDDLTEAAEQQRSDYARFITELSPGSVLQEREEPVLVATWRPRQREPGHRRQRGQHRRREDGV